MLEFGVRVVQGPDDAVNAALDLDEQARVAQSADCTTDTIADLDIAHVEEQLVEHRRLERELDEAIERRVTDDTGAVDRADSPRSARRRELVDAVVRYARDLRGQCRSSAGSTHMHKAVS